MTDISDNIQVLKNHFLALCALNDSLELPSKQQFWLNAANQWYDDEVSKDSQKPNLEQLKKHDSKKEKESSTKRLVFEKKPKPWSGSNKQRNEQTKQKQRRLNLENLFLGPIDNVEEEWEWEKEYDSWEIYSRQSLQRVRKKAFGKSRLGEELQEVTDVLKKTKARGETLLQTAEKDKATSFKHDAKGARAEAKAQKRLGKEDLSKSKHKYAKLKISKLPGILVSIRKRQNKPKRVVRFDLLSKR